MLPTIRTILFAVSALALAACGNSKHDGAHQQHAEAPTPQKTHGGHDPSHGGLVLMDGHDHHAELVLDAAAGAHRLYVSDGARDALPASTFDTVILTVTPPGGAPPEALAMTRAADDSHWVANGKPIAITGSKVKLSYGKGGATLYDVELPIEYILTGKMPEAGPVPAPAPTATHTHKDGKEQVH
jgi:hypothetical protein